MTLSLASERVFIGVTVRGSFLIAFRFIGTSLFVKFISVTKS